MKRKSVIVVGAGAAGVASGAKLQDLGYSVTLLEASGCVGGRIRHIDSFADFHIELGAEEVHGVDNCLVPLAKETGINLISHQTSNDYIRYDGKLSPLTQVSTEPELQEVLRFVSEVSDFQGNEYSVEQYGVLRHIPARSWHYLDSRMGVEHGTTLDLLGMRGFKGYESNWQLREDNYTLDKPYLRVLDPLLKKVEKAIRLNSAVELVDWSGERVVVGLRGGGKLEAEAVVYTGSVAVLRENPPEFFPRLPDKKIEAVRNIGMGGGRKILFKFSRRFWPDNMYFLHADTFWPQFWNPGKGRNTHDHILTTFVSGSRVTFVQQAGADLVDFGLGELDRIFGVGVASGCCVDAYQCDWTREEFIRGLYSFPTPFTKTEHRNALAEPLGGKVFFAGEATDAGGCSGTVHGAIESGWRVAGEIDSLLRGAESTSYAD